MGMTKKIAKGFAYSAAPKIAFTAFNPKKAAFVKAADWAMDRVKPQRRRRSRSAMAMKGLGAAAVALPVGMWLGRRFRGSEQQDEFRGAS